MIETPVCVIGCGPIGLTAALLLSRHGVASLLVERRSQLNTHPRSRFVDTNTMELLREFGLQEVVEASGLGPDWTAYNRWSNNLATEPYASIPSPTFLKATSPHTPCLPAMTVQDEVEKALMSKILDDPNITVRFDTEAIDLSQSDDATTLTLRDTKTDDRHSVTAQYIIGADGPGSTTRAAIDARLETNPMPMFMQDVLFRANLERYVGNQKGSLLYTQPAEGVLIFQPLNGRDRWRCQVSIPSEHLLDEPAIRDRIRASLGTTDNVELDITSMTLWQPTPGCVTRFSAGRIFLAGDAAHVAVPTGGLGNNAGFAGIRNLAWKIAYVVRGLAPPSILATYEIEHRPIALERIQFGIETTAHMGAMMRGHSAGANITAAIEGTHQYADYNHVLLGFEIESELVAANPAPAPDLDNSSASFTPLVRSGRRAPHIWIDRSANESVLDWFGRGYVLLLGPDCDVSAWTTQLEELATGVPLEVRQLGAEIAIEPYARDAVILVRPDGVIAYCGDSDGGASAATDVARYLP